MLYNNRVQCDIIYIVEEGIALMKGSEEMEMKLNLSVADIMSMIECLEFLKDILHFISIKKLDDRIALIEKLIDKLKSISL